jgi:septum formation protein
VVLASRSPRRRELLSRILPSFEVASAEVEEALDHHGGPAELAVENALIKARCVAASMPAGTWVIGADTVVCCDGVCLAKASCEAEAMAFIQRLSGRKHDVFTGITLMEVSGSVVDSRYEHSCVSFFKLGEAAIRQYVRVARPMDYAGAYAIQHSLGRLVSGFDGCYTNIVGLPMGLLSRMLCEHGLIAAETGEVRPQADASTSTRFSHD